MRKKYYVRTWGSFAEQYGWSYGDIPPYSKWRRTTKKDILFRIKMNKLMGEVFKAKVIYEIDTQDPHYNLKFDEID